MSTTSEDQDPQAETPNPDKALAQRLEQRFQAALTACSVGCDGVTIEVPRARLLELCRALRDEPEFAFEQLIDLCGVDYSGYGEVDWATRSATGTGFSRGKDPSESRQADWGGSRFAVVYHLLSISHNQRLRLRTYAEGEMPKVDSVVEIWASANWFEREAFDLFGILFEGHPDLRRILTDYGFIGHPFRKDFPLIGQVEMRYDPEKQRVVYQPVSIEARVNVPRVIRRDQRYAEPSEAAAKATPAKGT